MAKVVTEEQVATAPDPNAPEDEPKAPPQTKSQALETAAQAVWPAYVAFQEALESGDDGAALEAMKNLGREAGRVRRHCRLMTKGLKPGQDEGGNSIDRTDDEVHKILHRYNSANPIEPEPRTRAAAQTDDEDGDEETEDDEE